MDAGMRVHEYRHLLAPPEASAHRSRFTYGIGGGGKGEGGEGRLGRKRALLAPGLHGCNVGNASAAQHLMRSCQQAAETPVSVTPSPGASHLDSRLVENRAPHRRLAAPSSFSFVLIIITRTEKFGVWV